MSQQELLIKIIDWLEAQQIGYMLTGSYASSMQGEPRATHDVDIVVTVGPEHIATLTDVFPPSRYYISETAIREAIRHQTMFNLIDIESGDKADFWLLTDSPFDQTRFARRLRIRAMGRNLYVSSHEDTILAKLHWSKQSGGSEKQMQDARNILELHHQRLDFEYLERWSEQLGVRDLWHRLRNSLRRDE